MSAKMKIVLLGTLASLLLLPSLVQTGGARVVYLKATFRDSPGDPVNGILPDRIASDNNGPYQNASNVTVQFSDTGDLQFSLGEGATRRINFFFNSFNWLGPGPCADCSQVAGETWPDTTGTDPLLPDEPTTYVSFLTISRSGYAGPKLNFLAMKPGDVAPVCLRVYFETAGREMFRLRYFNSLDSRGDSCVVGGPVMVKAEDTNNDKVVDHWILYPVPNSLDKCLFYRDYTRRGNNWEQCSYGYFAMPFQLTLDRIK